MKTQLLGLMIAAASAALAQVTDSPQRTPEQTFQIASFAIATYGNDANPGTQEQPLATLEGAREAIKKLKKTSGLPAGGVTVWIHGGTYLLSKTFTLGADDSGAKGAPVVFRSCPGDKVILSGGRPISGFVAYKDQILKTDVSTQGLKGVYFRQLFLDGKRQPLARYPNTDPANPITGGWAYVAGKPRPMYANDSLDSKRILKTKPEDRRHWINALEAEVFIYPRFNWWNNIVPIESVDPSNGVITLSKDCSYAIRPNDRYFVQNLLEELDAPGEWYLDRTNSTLYFWPPSPLSGKTLSAPALKTLIHLDPGASGITFLGMTLEGSGGTAFEMKETTNCLIAGCSLHNIGDAGGNGILIDGGKNNGAVGNDISGIGRSGIVLQGGDRITLTPAGNYADNNHIHHIGIYYKEGVGVELGGCGNIASHNLIHDGPRFGILFSGNNLVMEYNHIHDVCLETEDTRAIYTGGRDWIGSRGSVIRYNFIHDIYGFGQDKGKWVAPFFAWGIYLDDNTGGVDVVGNIIARCSRACLHLHNGRDNLIQNNIFLSGTRFQVEYSGWKSNESMWRSHYPTMVKGYESVAAQPAWKAMRNMQLSPDRAALTNGLVMTGNQFFCNILDYPDPSSVLYAMRNVPFDHNDFDDNIVYHHHLPLTISITPKDKNMGVSPDQWNTWKDLGNDRHSVVADPLFQNASKDDYLLYRDSPAYRVGFKQIPTDKIGPYPEELRASWPIDENGGL